MPPPPPPRQSLLDAMCHEKHSLRAEIMHLSTKSFSILGTLGNRLLLLLDYIQVISPILTIGLYFQSDQEFYVPNIVQYFTRVLNPGSWIFFTHIESLEITILSLIGIVTILKYLLFGYIASVATGKITAWPPLIYMWKIIFHVQGRFIYFITSSFWISAMVLIKALREVTSSSKYYGIMCTGGIMVALEFGLSLYLNIYYVNVLPSKRFLAAKDNIIETLTLVQKLVIQMLILALDFTQPSTVFIFASFNCFVDLVRNLYYFGTLPFYSFKALSFQAVLQMIVTALNISYFTECVVKSFDGTSTHFLRLVLIWVVISLLLIKISFGFIHRRFWDLVANPMINSPALLIHRICAIEQIRNLTIPLNEYHEKNSWTLLVNNTLNVRIKQILKFDPADFQTNGVPFNINDRDLYCQMIRSYLAKLIKFFPKNKFIQLCTAQFYLKHLKLTQYPTQLIYKLQFSSDKTISLNAELLLMKVQDLLKNKSQRDNAALDLRKFLHEKSIYAQVKQKVIEQANLQIKICDEIKKGSPDLAKIFNDSQRLAIHRERTVKSFRDMLDVLSDYHTDPLLFCARYHLILNHSLHENIQYTKQYSQKLLKYQKFFDNDTLLEENIFGNDVGLTIISETEPTVGKVVYVSPSFAKNLGQNTHSMLSTNILKNSPPCLQEAYLAAHKMIAETGEKFLSNQIGRAFICQREGYLIEIDYYLNLHPFITSEFYLSLLQRPVVSNREFMYILENGDIDCITRGLGEKLSIKPTRFGSSPGTDNNLADISSEIALINEAFNMIFYAENPDVKRIAKEKQDLSLTTEEAQEIYSIYSTSGKDIILKSTAAAVQEDELFSYNCKITNIFLGKTFVKLFTLEENSKKTNEMRAGGELETPEYFLEQIRKEESEETSGGCEAVGEEFNPAKKDDLKQLKPITSAKRESGVDTTRCKDTQRDLLGSYREEDFSRISERFQPKMIQKRISESTGGKVAVKAKRESEGTRGQINANKAMSVGTSKWSKLSQQKRIFYLYKKSLTTKHYPKIYRFLLLLFSLVFIILTVCQALLKSTLDKNVDDLCVKKDILRCAQSRTYQLINIQSVIRILWDLRVGALSPAAFGSMASVVLIYPFLIGLYASQLSVINNELLLNTTSLDADIRRTFFAKDVVVYDTYFGVAPEILTSMDNFQATNRIVDSALEIANQGGVSGPDVEQLVLFILRNTLNGLLVKNEEISDTLVSSLATQRSQIDQNILAFFIGLILLFVVFLIVFTVYLWKQHFKQVAGLSAVCRVNPAKLNEVHRTFVNFMVATETEENINKSTNNTMGIISPKKKIVKRSFSDSATKRQYKTPNHLGLRKDCFITMGKFSILTSLVISLITITSIISQKHIQATQDMQAQIFFLDHSKSRVSIAAGIFLEVTSTNNTAEVEGVLVLEKLEELANELGQITRDLYATFIETGDNVKDSKLIQTVLIGDSCKTIMELFRPYCETLQSRGFKPGLIYLLTSFSTILKGQTQKYRASDKTEVSLNALKNEGFETTALMYLVTTTQLDILASVIDKNFEDEIDDTSKQRIYVLVVYIIAATFISVVMWRCIMVKLRAGVNKFKNVLSALPADLVLASFILRSFLMKTSNGVLNTVKNDLS